MSIISSSDQIANVPSKTCTHCKVIKPLSDYYRYKSRPDGHHHWCKACHNAYQKSTDLRKRDLKYRFGITIEEYDLMLERQGHVCAICRKPEMAKHADGKPRRLAVDHCYVTGKVRGLLCGSCNRLLGHSGEDGSVLRQAIEYLLIHTE